MRDIFAAPFEIVSVGLISHFMKSKVCLFVFSASKKNIVRVFVFFSFSSIFFSVSFVFRKSVSEELCGIALRAATVMSKIETKTNKFHEKGKKNTEHERDEITKCSKSNRMS